MFNTIVVAVDLNALDSAGPLVEAAKGLNAKALHVVSVMPDPGMAMVGMALGPDHADTMLTEAKDKLAAWAEEHLSGAEIHIRQGSVYDCILKAADAVGADAIVVGAHRPEFKDYLFGPNAARIARHARQSVLVVR